MGIANLTKFYRPFDVNVLVVLAVLSTARVGLRVILASYEDTSTSCSLNFLPILHFQRKCSLSFPSELNFTHIIFGLTTIDEHRPLAPKNCWLPGKMENAFTLQGLKLCQIMYTYPGILA